MKPKVSICCVTYNHEPYIKQTLDGFLMQKTDFDYEIIIYDDASTDQTQKIILEYQERFPDIIKPFLEKENQWSKGVRGIFSKFTFQRASGEYIALSEGDDYWLDSLKLQKQINFLEKNKDCTFCFHQAYKIKNQETDFVSFYPKNIEKSKLNALAFFKAPTVPTASVVFRSNVKFPEIYHSHGDFIWYCSFLSQGYAGFIPEIMSVYRLHEGGVSANYLSNSYLSKRIEELVVESNCLIFSKEVRFEINKILLNHCLLFLGKNRGVLSLKQKKHYIGIIYKIPSFYKLSLKVYLSLFKTLLN